MPDIGTGITVGVPIVAGLLDGDGRAASRGASENQRATREELEAYRSMWNKWRQEALPQIVQSWQSYGEILPSATEHTREFYDAELDDRQHYEDVVRPLYAGLIDRYQGIADEPYDDAYIAGRAASEYDKQAGIARMSRDRELQRMGVRPDSGKYAGLSDELVTAGGRAAAINDARFRERNYRDAREEMALAALRDLHGTGHVERSLTARNLPSLPNDPVAPGASNHASATAVRDQRSQNWMNTAAGLGRMASTWF